MRPIDADATLSASYIKEILYSCFENIIKNQPTVHEEEKWLPIPPNTIREAPPVGELMLVSIRDDFGDTTNYYTSCGWMTSSGDWIVDNEECSGVYAWKPMPEADKKWR